MKKSKKSNLIRNPTPQRETDAYQPQMRDRLRSLRPGILARPGVLDFMKTIIRKPDLREVEDLRHDKSRPVQPRRYMRVDGNPAGYGYKQVQVLSRLRRLRESLRLSFQHPDQTVVCVRRRARRRVLFALQKTGKAGRGNRRARWSASSRIQCRGVK